MNDLQIFKNNEFGEIRTAIINNEPYLMLNDVCYILGISNPRDVKSRLNDKGVAITDILTKGGKQQATFINESNLYRVIFQSRKPEAELFTEWVTSEVLPTIRKTGGYVDNTETFVNTYFENADDATKQFLIVTLDEKKRILDLNKKLQSEIEHKDTVIIGLVDEISLAEKRQIINRVVRYKNANFQERWRELYKQFEMKYHIDLTYRFETYNATHKPKLKNKIDYIDKVMNKIPALYEIACKLYENDVKELASQLYEIAI